MDVADRIDHLRASVAVAGVTVPDVHLPTERDVVVNGIRLHLLDWGATGAPPIVLLHGGSLTAHTWDVVCLALSDRYRCLAVDLRGHGESEWPPDADYALDTLAADVRRVIETEGLRRPVVIGMSLGGLTAMRLAAEISADLSGLVIVDVSPEMHLEAARRIVDFVRVDREVDSIDDFISRSVAFNPTRRPDLLRRSLQYNVRRLPNGRWTWKSDPRRLDDADLAAMRDEHAQLWELVAHIRCPALVVRGERSRVLLDEDAARLVATIPDAAGVVVAGAGHTVQGDNPRRLLEVVEPFLASCFADAGR